VGTFSSTNVGTVYSACLWLRYNDSGDGVVIGSGGEYEIYIDGASAGSSMYLLANDFVSVVHGGFTAATWYHVCVTRNGTAINFYKNGSQIGTQQNLIDNVDRFIDSFGAKSDGSNPCQCDIDDVRYYDTELTSGEVLALYNSYSSGPPSSVRRRAQ
jgi:hypothetical protein